MTLIEEFFFERIHLLKKAAQEKAQAERAYAAASFKSMVRDKGDITVSSRWSRVCYIGVRFNVMTGFNKMCLGCC
jgi:transcription elongation regulator 1